MSKDDCEVNRAFWVERIAEFRASGLSAPRWCAVHSLKLRQLRYWLKKLETQVPAQEKVRWLPVEVSDPELPFYGCGPARC